MAERAERVTRPSAPVVGRSSTSAVVPSSALVERVGRASAERRPSVGRALVERWTESRFVVITKCNQS